MYNINNINKKIMKLDKNFLKNYPYNFVKNFYPSFFYNKYAVQYIFILDFTNL